MPKTLHKTPRPVVLCILDGWGHAKPGPYNAIALANTPTYDRWWKSYPQAFLKTSGTAVGLPEGQMGNSEVGHMNIGAGRVVKQDLPRINEAIKNGSFQKNPTLKKLIESLKKSGGALHLMGLMSPGGVHSHQDHMQEIAAIVSGAGIPVLIHAFLDGRDTPPQSGLEFVRAFEEHFVNNDLVSIASVTGRYFAMDRDHRWDRVEKAYQAVAHAEGLRQKNTTGAIEAAYGRGETDEFVTPSVIGDYQGMKDGDALFMANFRADRAREILATLVDPAFDGFDRGRVPDFCERVGMVEYSTELNANMTLLFPPVEVKDGLGELISRAGLKQLRIAETEKYAHVTFFFNGGEEKILTGEERILIPSPKVATYDLKPEMSAPEVTERLIAEIMAEKFGFIVINFANPDMVGHTGKLKAAIKAVEVVDTCLGKIEETLLKKGGVLLMSADHGNIEQMIDPTTDVPHTAHTTCDVPVILVGSSRKGTLKNGSLADIAPTILDLLGLVQPEAMTGHTLIKGSGKG